MFSTTDFLIINEVEKLLKKYKVVLTKKDISNSSTITRIYNDKNQNRIIYPKKGFLQVVGSDLKKHNAENSMLRLDCNLDFKNKSRFIEDLKDVTNEERVDVFFYYDKDFNDKTNLMLFFTNGRQGLSLSNKKYTDILSFEDKIENIAKANNVNFGHEGGLDLYPYSRNARKIEKMIEQEFIL